MARQVISLKKAGISRKRYKELTGFCEQYAEWKEKLIELQPSISAKLPDGMPFANTNDITDSTATIAIKIADVQEKIDLIDKVAFDVGDDMQLYLIKSVCYGHSILDLINSGMPISERSFKRMRLKFFVKLDKLKN